MKFNNLVAINGLLFIGLGIAFALYGPLMLNLFGVLEEGGTSPLSYWHTVSFARLYGAALFGFGFLLWALRASLAHPNTAAQTRRGIALSLVLAYGLALVVALTQQTSIWGTPAGWVTAGLYAILVVLYALHLR